MHERSELHNLEHYIYCITRLQLTALKINVSCYSKYHTYTRRICTHVSPATVHGYSEGYVTIIMVVEGACLPSRCGIYLTYIPRDRIAI